MLRLFTVIMLIVSFCAPTQAEEITYEVVSGDTLSKIAKRYLGNVMKYKEIYNDNQELLRKKGPHFIVPGMLLVINTEAPEHVEDTVIQTQATNTQDNLLKVSADTMQSNVSGWNIIHTNHNWLPSKDKFTGHINTHGLAGSRLGALALMLNNLNINSTDALKIARGLVFTDDSQTAQICTDGYVVVENRKIGEKYIFNIEAIAINTSKILIGKIIPRWKRRCIDAIVSVYLYKGNPYYYAESSRYKNPLLLRLVNTEKMRKPIQNQQATNTPALTETASECKPFTDSFGFYDPGCEKISVVANTTKVINGMICTEFIDSFNTIDYQCINKEEVKH